MLSVCEVPGKKEGVVGKHIKSDTSKERNRVHSAAYKLAMRKAQAEGHDAAKCKDPAPS